MLKQKKRLQQEELEMKARIEIRKQQEEAKKNPSLQSMNLAEDIIDLIDEPDSFDCLGEPAVPGLSKAQKKKLRRKNLAVAKEKKANLNNAATWLKVHKP